MRVGAAVQASHVIHQAQTALQDPDGVRWPAAELVTYLNDGQRALATARPDTTTVTRSVPMAAGTRQTLPSDAMALVDVPVNAAGRRRPLTKVDRKLLDAALPEWQTASPADAFVHFIHDLREPRVFHLYPPARQGALLELVYAAYPADVALPNGPRAEDVIGNTAFAAEWEPALVHYVLHRAYAKDAEFAAAAQLSASYLALFNQAMGAQLTASVTVAPKT